MQTSNIPPATTQKGSVVADQMMLPRRAAIKTYSLLGNTFKGKHSVLPLLAYA